jgi:hypothetical protein
MAIYKYLNTLGTSHGQSFDQANGEKIGKWNIEKGTNDTHPSYDTAMNIQPLWLKILYMNGV